MTVNTKDYDTVVNSLLTDVETRQERGEVAEVQFGSIYRCPLFASLQQRSYVAGDMSTHLGSPAITNMCTCNSCLHH